MDYSVLSEKVSKYIKKHRIIITFLIFIFLIVVMNDFNIFVVAKKYKELNNLKQQEIYLRQRLVEDSIRYMQLKTDDKSLETFAREQYYFHKSDEDVFLIEYNK